MAKTPTETARAENTIACAPGEANMGGVLCRLVNIQGVHRAVDLAGDGAAWTVERITDD